MHSYNQATRDLVHPSSITYDSGQSLLSYMRSHPPNSLQITQENETVVNGDAIACCNESSVLLWGTVITFDKCGGESKSLKVLKIFISHKKYVKDFITPQ